MRGVCVVCVSYVCQSTTLWTVAFFAVVLCLCGHHLQPSPWQTSATISQALVELLCIAHCASLIAHCSLCFTHGALPLFTQVVLAPSILSTEQVLTSLPIQRLRRNTLFVDVLSVKVFPKQLMMTHLPPEVGRGGRRVCVWEGRGCVGRDRVWGGERVCGEAHVDLRIHGAFLCASPPPREQPH